MTFFDALDDHIAEMKASLSLRAEWTAVAVISIIDDDASSARDAQACALA